LALIAPCLTACVEDDPDRDAVIPPQDRAEQSLYAEVALALRDGSEPIPAGGGDPMDGATTGMDGGGGETGGDPTAGDPMDPTAGDPMDPMDPSAGGGSCFGVCGEQAGDCWCDDTCTTNGDCCADFAAACPSGGDGGGGGDGAADGGGPTSTSCVGACGDISVDGCWCDADCVVNGDCCDDYASECAGAAMDAGRQRGLDELVAGIEGKDASLACLASWTIGGGVGGVATGALVGEAVSKSCAAGGVIIGVLTGGTGFAAATVCLAGDVTQADAAIGAVVGGVYGALQGLVTGLSECSSEQMQQADDALGLILESRGTTDRVFVAPISAGKSASGTCNPCPPEPDEPPEPDRVDCVPPSTPHGECTSHHVHVYAWKTEQNPSDCVCRYKADETYLCYDPVADPGFAANEIWDRCK
jgi:hypothetical protein